MSTKTQEQGQKVPWLVFDVIFTVVLLIADQLTKKAAVSHLQGQPDMIIWDGVFQLHYLENKGAAFSMLENASILFIIVAIIMLAVIVYVLTKVPAGKRYMIWHICLSMIAAGAIGNMIDRIKLSYVIDFLYFSLINFPVFNVADICVTVGVALLCVFVLFVWKDEDMEFLSRKKA
ncbi:MAG: signal peptidase II, partial [Lachnospiraceae bacterium]|nr:signal peptidase II [Lachnospiraceae bacterium]